MAYTFFRAQGDGHGKSLVEEDKVGLAKELLAKAEGARSACPPTTSVAAAFKEDAEHRTASVTGDPEGWMGLDIGPITRTAFAEEVRKARDRLLERARWASSR
jgi:phosphoglycerate kinase